MFSGPINQQSAGQFISQQKFVLPNSTLKNNPQSVKPQPPVIPARKNAPPLKPFGEIKSQPKKEPAIKLPPVNIPKTSGAALKPPLGKPLSSLEELLKSKKPTNNLGGAQSNSEIDRKLQDLRKRVNK